MVGVLSSDSPWAGICICKKLCLVGEGARTELALCALLACNNLSHGAHVARPSKGIILLAMDEDRAGTCPWETSF